MGVLHIDETARANRPSFKLRLTAAVIDYTIYGVFFFAYVRYFGSPTADGYQVSGCGYNLGLVTAWVLWLPLPEAVLGRTFGKWACDLRVVDLSGLKITAGQAFLRRLLDPIDFFTFFGLVGFIVAKATPLNQRVGDLVAKTRVVADAQTDSGAAV